MMRLSLFVNKKTGIKISVILFVLSTGLNVLNIAIAQIQGSPEGTTAGTPPFGVSTGGMPNDRRDMPGTQTANPLSGVPDETSFPNGTAGAYPPDTMRLPDTYRNPSREPNGAGQTGNEMPGTPGLGMETQNPQTMQDAANQSPTLGEGGQHTGSTTSGQSEGSEYLKSVQYQSHPLNDFLVLLGRHPGNAVPEKDIYLYEVLSGVTSPNHRRELLKAYWNLSEKMMQISVRKAQRQRLGQVQKSMQSQQLPTDEVDLALQLVAQQELVLELEFIQAQYRFLDLQSKIPTLSGEWRVARGGDARFTPNSTLQTPSSVRPLPIPADFPLAVPYNTKIEELKKTRTLSQKSLLLNQTIPLQYQAIVARTAARSYANIQWITVFEKSGQPPVAQIETLAREEMALISTIIEYNHQVDEYVIETFGTNIPEKQLLASILVLPKRPTTEIGQTQNRMQSTFSQ